MTDERLIEEARRWPSGVGPIPSAAPANIIKRLADALEAAEKAHTPTTPTDEERGALEQAVLDGLNAHHAQSTMDPTLVEERVGDAVWAAGFRRAEVPEPSAMIECPHWAEESDGFCTCNGANSGGRMRDCGIAAHRAEAFAQRSQNEPSNAHVAAAMKEWRHGVGDDWERMRAALRAASAVTTEQGENNA